MAELWTPLKLIQWTKGYFEKAGVPNARLDAELLLAYILKCKRIDLYTNHERTIREKDLARFKELIQRRVKREPLQYIIGETEFYGLKFKITPDVLIPRPETELLVEEALKQLNAHNSPLPPSYLKRGNDEGAAPQILEIGTGSGCIAIALAKNLPGAKIIATDISKEALEIAKENARQNEVDSKIEFILSDVASIIPGGGYADFPPGPPNIVRSRGVNPTLAHSQFDLIVSNPPYIATSEIESLQPEVRDFEPRQALDGGDDGLEIIKQILAEAIPYLKTDGLLLMEIGEDQGQAVRVLSNKNQDLKSVEVKKDLSGKDRIACFAPGRS